MNNKEANLKREFKKRDVERMRHIILGTTGERTQVQAGWEKQTQVHKEGDVWEEDNKTWTIKNGIKQTVTKMDALKKLMVIPLCCPSCSKPMKINDLNKKMYAIHGICFDCTIDMEHKIKSSGGWDEYVKRQQSSNKVAMLTDLEAALESWYTQKDTFVTEGGDVESWTGGEKETAYEYVKKEIAKAKEGDIYNKSE